jgi:tripartite motif-containing protein 71
LSKLKYLLMIFLVCLSCASSGALNDSTEEGSVSDKTVKGFKPVGIVGDRELGTAYLYQPTGIAVDPLGSMFITDTGNDRLVKCDEDGRFLAQTGGFGWEEGQFNRPGYITTDNGLNLYVVDVQNKRIQRFDQNLNFISVIDIKSEEDYLGLGLPEGIAITPSGELFVSDIQEDRVVKFDGFLEYERNLGGFAESQGGLRDPMGICVDRNGEIYVADSQNDRLVVFDAFGNVLSRIGEGILKGPYGVEVDRNGLVYVANTGGNNVVVFDSKGKLVFEYGGSAPGIMGLSRPTDLKLDRRKRLLVADSGNNRILIFEVMR